MRVLCKGCLREVDISDESAESELICPYCGTSLSLNGNGHTEKPVIHETTEQVEKPVEHSESNDTVNEK